MMARCEIFSAYHIAAIANAVSAIAIAIFLAATAIRNVIRHFRADKDGCQIQKR